MAKNVTALRESLGDERAMEMLMLDSPDFKSLVDKWSPHRDRMSAASASRFPSMMLDYHQTGSFNTPALTEDQRGLHDTLNSVYSPKSKPSSLSERFQRSFGSQEVREGRVEKSKGFDIKDIPGDIADVAGKTLPFLGSAVGVPLIASGVGALPGATISAAGGALGESARQGIGDLMNVEQKYGSGGEDVFNVEEVQKEAALGFFGELGGRALFAVGKAAIAPFFKSVDSEVLETAAKLGIGQGDIPVSVQTKSPILQTAEGASQKTLLGGRVSGLIEKFEAELLKQGRRIATQSGGDETISRTPLEVAELLGDAVSQAKTSRVALKDALYDEAGKALAKGGKKKLVPSDVISLVDELIRSDVQAVRSGGKIAKSPIADGLSELRNKLANGGSPADLAKLSDAISARSTEMSGSAGAKLRKVAQALDEYLDTTLPEILPEAADLLAQADSATLEIANSFGGQVARLVKAVREDPASLSQRFATGTTPTKFAKLREILSLTPEGEPFVAGQKALNALRMSVANDLLDSSVKAGNPPIFDPKLFARKMQRLKPSIYALYDKPDADMLMGLATLTRKAAESTVAASGAQTGALMAKLFVLVASAISGGGQAAAAVIGTDLALAKAFSSPLARKWLTTGFSFNGKPLGAAFQGAAGQKLKTGLAIGTKAALQGAREKLPENGLLRPLTIGNPEPVENPLTIK